LSKATAHKLSDYKYRLTLPTRWNDNDVYGHVNNAVYYFYFDTVVNRFLIENDLLEIGKSDMIGLVVDTGCSFFAPMSFPDDVTAALRVAKIGQSSVRYEIGLFRNQETVASAQGHFVHVYVDEKTRRPAAIAQAMKVMSLTSYRAAPPRVTYVGTVCPPEALLFISRTSCFKICGLLHPALYVLGHAGSKSCGYMRLIFIYQAFYVRISEFYELCSHPITHAAVVTFLAHVCVKAREIDDRIGLNILRLALGGDRVSLRLHLSGGAQTP